MKSPKTLHVVQLYPYLLLRSVDGSPSAPEGGALIWAPPFWTSSLPYLFPQTHPSFPEGLSFKMCKYSWMWTYRLSSTPIAKESFTVSVTPRCFSSFLSMTPSCHLRSSSLELRAWKLQIRRRDMGRGKAAGFRKAPKTYHSNFAEDPW